MTEIDGQLRTAQDDYETVQAQLAAQIEAERRAREEAERRAREQAARDATSTTVPAEAGDDPPSTDPPSTDPPSTEPSTDPRRILPTTHPRRPLETVPVTARSRDRTASPTLGAHPASGGRYHKGVDIMAAHGTPVVAVYDGSIYRFSTSSLGGIHHLLPRQLGKHLLLRTSRRLRPGAAAGVPMAAGELIGYVGNTGNAAWTAPTSTGNFNPVAVMQ